MKKRIRPTALLIMTLVLLIAGAMVTMIVGYASDYYTYTFYYQYEDGTSAHDPYIAVFAKDSEMDRTVKNPIIQGYQPYDSKTEDANLVTEVKLQGEITCNQTMTFYYKPEMVPFRVSYFLQNINDDDYTATLTLPDRYYQKADLTGTFPEDLDDFSDDPYFKGFTKLYHTPDFIAADGSTEFEIYFSRNYYLIDFLLDGGYGTESVYAKYNSNYNIAEPTKKGYGLLETDAYYQPERPTVNRTFYAIFKMNYTLNYVYQGRRGGNDGSGSYVGDDAETDEKVYSVILKNLKTEDLEENGMPIAKHLVDNAPAIDDLYKDCIWTINDQHVSFDNATLTVTITAVQNPRTCVVDFRYQGKTFKVEKVKLNSLVMPNGKFVEAPESDGGNPFAYWSVKETDTGKEIAQCYDRAFDLRATGNITVTACYGAEAQRLFISDASYTREQTRDAAGNLVDKLY